MDFKRELTTCKQSTSKQAIVIAGWVGKIQIRLVFQDSSQGLIIQS